MGSRHSASQGVRYTVTGIREFALELLDTLRRQARFALKSTDDRSALPHAKAMRIQVGGLRGLHAALAPDEPIPAKIDDVNGLIEAAIARFGDLASLPFQPIIQQIAAYKGRRLRRLK